MKHALSSKPATFGYQIQRFAVRDISRHYDAPTFDVVFDDDDAQVVRYLDAVYTSRHDAEIEAARLEEARLRPVHWEVAWQKTEGGLNQSQPGKSV